ncbi:MAG: family 20 glycosylhydrolase [Oscillospiraceae bacterium]
MSFLDTYTYFKNEKISLKNAKIIGLNNKVAIEYLRSKFSSNSFETVIRFVNNIPHEIIQKINKTFGNVYEENDDGYIIEITDEISVYSNSDCGLFMGAYAVARHIKNAQINMGIIYNFPISKYRGIKVYLPARKDIKYFKEFIDFCTYYGYNRVMIEVGGAMEYKKHPEINAGWIEYCNRFKEYQGQSLDIQNSPKWARNSIHCENGGGDFLTQNEVKNLIAYCEARCFEVIPEVPSLSHCDYLLVNHPELRERKDDDLPDTYCPSNPESYKLLFSVLDEVISVFNPKTVQIGHDEFFSVALCDKCKGKDAGELYAGDVKKIYEYLKNRGVSTALWGDKLLNAIGMHGQTWGGSRRVIVNMRSNVFLEEVPATFHAINLIPKDLEIYHWYWGLNSKWENEFFDRDFKTIMGNFDGICMRDWEMRKHNYKGISISNWSLLNLSHMQRNSVLMNIGYSAYMQFNKSFNEDKFKENALMVAHDIYLYHLREYENYFSVVHRTKIYKNHMPFVDGFYIDKNDDYLGKYVVLFESGHEIEIPLYYNLNIGTAQGSFEINKANDNENMVYDAQIFESTFTCDIEERNGEIFYRTAFEIPKNEKVKKISLVQNSKYKINIELEEILI